MKLRFGVTLSSMSSTIVSASVSAQWPFVTEKPMLRARPTGRQGLRHQRQDDRWKTGPLRSSLGHRSHRHKEKVIVGKDVPP